MLFQLIQLWVMVWMDVHDVGNAVLLLHLHLLDSSMPPMIRESFFSRQVMRKRTENIRSFSVGYAGRVEGVGR